jgi:hypothetical protein
LNHISRRKETTTVKKHEIKVIKWDDPILKRGKLKGYPVEYEKLFDLPGSASETDGEANQRAAADKKRKRPKTKGS